MLDFHTGMIMLWAGQKTNIPAGWAECDGTPLNTAQYPALQGIIGNSFGASPPSGQFYLPDLRGQFVRGVDDGAGRDPDIGTRVDMQNPDLAYSGVGSVQACALQSHDHDYNETVSNSDKNGTIDDGKFYDTSGNTTYSIGGANISDSETRPINAYLYYIIKL